MYVLYQVLQIAGSLAFQELTYQICCVRGLGKNCFQIRETHFFSWPLIATGSQKSVFSLWPSGVLPKSLPHSGS